MIEMDATREIGWIAHEARALMNDDSVRPDSPWWQEYLDRKRVLLAYVAARQRATVT